ncbi:MULTISPECIES: ribokinase [Inquilinus]|uniref:Ribokinase n=1 Tax=Inquilinus ginsengisoli TaxID=363840 RepID=A0ABU1JJZ4_9PROT|nr:ribokinase [Inquilinus ginsengisoli]MDR6288931.1 ribokinase [Inquilinus ginsengisoli]
MALPKIAIQGVFVADLAFRAARLPMMGETLLSNGFKLGPGGKGSNQSVAAARAGADVAFITKIGADPFGEMARGLYAAEGIDSGHVLTDAQRPTGAAFIFIDSRTGENAIIIEAGAAAALTEAEMEAAAPAIAGARIFVAQLELPLPVVRRGLEIARRHGVTTILNPAPAMALPDDLYPLVDYLTPNETEAESLVDFAVDSGQQAERAAQVLLAKGVGAVVVTLGAKGALLKNRSECIHIPAFSAGEVVETAGAGDAFNGGFALALAEGRPVAEAVRFGCAVAGISVTRPGTAPSMPRRDEVEALLRNA